MGFIAPFIAPVAGAIGSLWAAKKAGSAAEDHANQLNQQGQAAFTGAQGAAQNLSSLGTGLVGQGQATTAEGLATAGKGTNYYSALLGGNRALQSQAVAAPRAAITDVYRGAERNLDRGGVRGAAKDVATADLGRQKAGQISSLITGVQPGAAQALTSTGLSVAGVGGQQTGQGLGAVGNAGSLLSGLYGPSLGQGQFAQKQGQAAGDKTGGMLGGLLFDIINGVLKQKGSGSGSSSGGGGGGMSTWTMPGWGLGPG